MEHKISSELPPLPANPDTRAVPAPEEVLSGDIRNEAQVAQAVEAGAPLQSSVGLPPLDPKTTQAQAQSTSNPTSDPTMPVIADDVDVIEKEWVLKAKEIVTRTSDDPYTQNKEVERMKADYMKKRYNKDIKIAED